MSNSVVLITGALTGIGRATAFAHAKEGARVVVSGRNKKSVPSLYANCAPPERKRNLSVLTCVMKRTLRTLSTRPSLVLAVSTSPSTTQARKMLSVRQRT